MNCPNCGSVQHPHESPKFGDWFACGTLGDGVTHLCRSLRDDSLRIVPKIKACAGDHIRDAAKMVETLQDELKHSRTMIELLQADNRRITRTLEKANTANERARAMICDAAGIPHDADIVEWIKTTRERLKRLENAVKRMSLCHEEDQP